MSTTMNVSDKLPVGHHSGEEILQKLLKKFYNFKTLDEYQAYASQPIWTDFSHVDGLLKVFMVAEKNLMAQALASRLAKPFERMRYYKDYGLVSLEDAKLNDPEDKQPYLKLHKFQCDMLGRKAEVLMAATNGHLFTQDFGQPLRDPADAFTLDIIEKPDDDRDTLLNLILDDTCKPEKFDSSSKFDECGGSSKSDKCGDSSKCESNDPPRKNQSKMFRDLAAAAAEGSDAVVLWLDNDNAGEKICYEVIDALISSLNPSPTGNKMDVIYRATFSSANEAKDSLRQLGRPDFMKYLGKVLQHYWDLITGLSFSRHQIMVLRKAFPYLDIKDLPFGPCQTTALGMCVNQCLRKQSCHKHVVEITLSINGKKLKAVSAEFDDKQSATDCCKKFYGLKCQVLAEPSQDTVTVPAPAGLNTFEYLKFCSKYFKYSPHLSAQILQNLYERGFVTYGRTESTKYPAYMFENDRMQSLFQRTKAYLSDKNKGCYDLDTSFAKAKSVGVDVGDHPPIMPSFKDTPDSAESSLKLDYASTEVYDIVCSWLLATFMKDYTYAKETTLFGINGVKFEFTCQKEVEEGFTKVLKHFKVETTEENFSKAFIQGAEFAVENIEVKRSPTSPELLNEYSLIEKMEEHRIGTDCSIPEHINNIERTKYVEIDPKHREFEPTHLGLTLIESYKKCVCEFIQPSYRQTFIQHVEEVAAGKEDFVKVYNYYLKEAWKFLQIFKANFNAAKLDLNRFQKCFGHRTGEKRQQYFK